jgi:Kef-type K+ transport system membrane component KefB
VKIRPAALGLAIVLDIVLVLLFALIGRASHGENALAGLFVTAWPFLAGAFVGWLVGRVWRAPFAPWRGGLWVWGGALLLGMVLRVASGQGIAVSFIIVAAIVLFVFLVGWRLIASLVGRGRASRSA